MTNNPTEPRQDLNKEKNKKTHWDGYSVTPNSFWVDKNLDPYKRNILGLILSFDYVDKKRFTLSYMEKCIGISTSTIRRKIRELCEQKYIEVELIVDEKGSPLGHYITPLVETKVTIGRKRSNNCDRTPPDKDKVVPTPPITEIPPPPITVTPKELNNNKRINSSTSAAQKKDDSANKSKTENSTTNNFNDFSEILDFWNKQFVLKSYRPDRSTLNGLLSYFSALLDIKTKEEIKNAIKAYSEALTVNQKLHKWSFEDFIRRSRFMIKDGNSSPVKKYFDIKQEKVNKVTGPIDGPNTISFDEFLEDMEQEKKKRIEIINNNMPKDFMSNIKKIMFGGATNIEQASF